MPADDPAEDETPVFTEADVYMIVGFVAAAFDIEDDVTDETEQAIQAVLSRV